MGRRVLVDWFTSCRVIEPSLSVCELFQKCQSSLFSQSVSPVDNSTWQWGLLSELGTKNRERSCVLTFPFWYVGFPQVVSLFLSPVGLYVQYSHLPLHTEALLWAFSREQISVSCYSYRGLWGWNGIWDPTSPLQVFNSFFCHFCVLIVTSLTPHSPQSWNLLLGISLCGHLDFAFLYSAISYHSSNHVADSKNLVIFLWCFFSMLLWVYTLNMYLL